MVEPFTRKTAEKVLRRLFQGGRLRHLPRSRRDTELLIALAASSLDTGGELNEQEVNAQLVDWLEDISEPATLDHVTIRRYLVDYRMLLRDQEGARYRTNQAVVSTYITAEARSVRPVEILDEVQCARALRRRSNSGEEN